MTTWWRVPATAASVAPPKLGGLAPDTPGYDLLGAVVGSEGTLGVATSVTVKLTRLPQEVRTLLAGFESTDDAGAATSSIIAAGIVPAALPAFTSVCDARITKDVNKNGILDPEDLGRVGQGRRILQQQHRPVGPVDMVLDGRHGREQRAGHPRHAPPGR